MEKESSGEKSLAKLITGDHVIEKFQGLVRSYRVSKQRTFHIVWYYYYIINLFHYFKLAFGFIC